MKTNRFILLLLSLLLTTSSCGTATNEANTSNGAEQDIVLQETETETETETELKDAVPEDLNFGGANFVFLAAEEYGAPSLVEDLNGEVYNDATYGVEVYAEERLDVNISEELTAWNSVKQTVVNLVTSNDKTYDTISMTDRDSLSVATQGVFHLMEDIPYVDLSQKYWGEGLREELSIGGKEYFAISSFNLYSLQRTTCILFNEVVADKFNIEVPFEAVFDGTWTQDMIASYSSIATVDVNGNGVMDSSDSYTYGTTDPRDIGEKLMYASGFKWIDIDEEGFPYVAVYGNENIINVFEWTRRIFLGSDSIVRENYEDDFANINALTELFVNDQELLCVFEFRHLDPVREMESDFSILPLPKFNESQQRYYSYTSNVIFSMVPVTATDLEKAGAVQEIMSCEGYKKMLPAFIESTMKNKIARNQESAEIIQIIYDTRAYDLGKLYLFSQLGNQVYQNLKAGNSVIPVFEAKRDTIDGALEKIITSLTALE